MWNTGTPSIGSDLTVNNMSLNGAANIWTTVNGGHIPGISFAEKTAYWTWWDYFQNSASQNGYALFRTKEPVSAVPIPGSVLLMGTGLLGLWVAGRKRRQP